MQSLPLKFIILFMNEGGKEARMVHTRFIQRCAEPASFRGLPDWFSGLLRARGITTDGEADRFLHPSPEGLHDPFLLPGMEKTVELLRGAISRGETILVYGDYDADGVCAASILFCWTAWQKR